MPMFFVPKETRDGETRVAATPESVRQLVRAGFEVAVQAGAGAGALYTDEAYGNAGARIVDSQPPEADLVARVQPPTPAEARSLKKGAVHVSFLWPHANAESVRALADAGATAFAMDRIPRITRAQSMDALSSQANIAGYKAAVMAADNLPRLMPLLMTAAGTLTPAKVVVLGAGVAGLQAIATARRLGAVVEVSDVRLAAKEQVESLGARFIVVEGAEDLEEGGGYAKEASAEFLQRQQAEVRKHIVNADAVITTAQIPGKPAPRLIPADMVREMRPGSVIVDVAAEQGGNCELTRPGETVVENGVRIIGTINLPGLVPTHASSVYARNVLDVAKHLFREGALHLDMEDAINAAAIVVADRNGRNE